MNDLLRQQLHDLPDAAPSDALWARLADARQRQVRRQRGVIAGGTAACAALVATLFFNLGLQPGDDKAAPVTANTVTLASTTPAISNTPSESLHHIDRELQLAYARNADDAELASLWAVRQGLLHSRTDTVQPLGI